MKHLNRHITALFFLPFYVYSPLGILMAQVCETILVKIGAAHVSFKVIPMPTVEASLTVLEQVAHV